MAGYNQEKKSNKKYNAKRTNLIVEDIPDLDLATGEQSMSSEDTYWAINGFFFRFNYNYKQRIYSKLTAVMTVHPSLQKIIVMHSSHLFPQHGVSQKKISGSR